MTLDILVNNSLGCFITLLAISIFVTSQFRVCKQLISQPTYTADLPLNISSANLKSDENWFGEFAKCCEAL